MNKKRIIKIAILSSLLFIIAFFIVKVFNQTCICSYSYSDSIYTMNETVNIKYNSRVSINKIYTSEFDEVLLSEKQELINKGFKIDINDNSLNAHKNEKSKDNYYETIKEYKNNGYNCKFKFL